MENQKKILVVDDSAALRKLFQDELKAGGYEVIQSEGGPDALKKVSSEEPPDLVTLDIEMPGMNGFEVCRMLYSKDYSGYFSSHRNNRVPVVFLTANDTVKDRRKGFELGATDFIHKPFKKGELLKVVDNILNPESKLHGLTVLVVDDSKITRLNLLNTLERSNVNVLEAENGVRGFEIISDRKDEIDILITDLMMPEMNGDEFCQKVRNNLDLKDLPIIFLTGISEQSELLNLFDVGGTDYIIKPFAKEELLARISVHLERAKLTKELRKTVSSLNTEVAQHQQAEDEIKRLNIQLKKHVLENSEKLKDAKAEIVERESQSEVADITPDTLRDIADTLSGIKTSSDIIAKAIFGSTFNSFKNANKILKENISNIESFICYDPKGKKLLEHYLTIEKMFDDEFEISLKHVNRLKEKVGRIEKAVSAQPADGGDDKETETVDVSKIIEEALAMQSTIISDYCVNVTKTFNKVPEIKAQKSKIMHVLAALIKNAKDAMLNTSFKNRNMTIETNSDNSSVFIKVKDVGQGIPKEDLDKIFSHGYTTKEDAQGHDLHNSARYMKEMNGEISVESPGKDKGTIFSLKFPIPGKTG